MKNINAQVRLPINIYVIEFAIAPVIDHVKSNLLIRPVLIAGSWGKIILRRYRTADIDRLFALTIHSLLDYK